MVGIYKITSPSGKVYIGQSREVERRILKYKCINRSNGQPYLNRSFKKYGIENHLFEIIHELPNDIEQSVLNRYEQLYMDSFRDCGITLLNCREAGSIGKLHSETKKKISIACKGKKGYWEGKKLSDETRLKMSVIGKARVASGIKLKGIPFAKGNKIWFGRNHSEETKKKIGLANSSDNSEARKVNAVANFKKASEKNKIPVMQFDKNGNHINAFPSIKEAAVSLNILETGISQACRGKLKTSGGFKWAYKN